MAREIKLDELKYYEVEKDWDAAMYHPEYIVVLPDDEYSHSSKRLDYESSATETLLKVIKLLDKRIEKLESELLKNNGEDTK